jgi:hypothetical protein
MAILSESPNWNLKKLRVSWRGYINLRRKKSSTGKIAKPKDRYLTHSSCPQQGLRKALSYSWVINALFCTAFLEIAATQHEKTFSLLWKYFSSVTIFKIFLPSCSFSRWGNTRTYIFCKALHKERNLYDHFLRETQKPLVFFLCLWSKQ